MDFIVRRAILSDTEKLANLIRDLGLFSWLDDEPEQETVERVRRHLDRSYACIYVAEMTDGDIAGYTTVHWVPYLILDGAEGYVTELFVAEAFRGKGMGTRLLESVLDEAKERRCSRLSLVNLRDRESYQRRFYEKLGWRVREGMANFVYDLSS